MNKHCMDSKLCVYACTPSVHRVLCSLKQRQVSVGSKRHKNASFTRDLGPMRLYMHTRFK